MKKIVLILMSLLLTFGMLTGCTNSGDDDTDAGFDYDNDITVVSREDGSGTRGAFVELFEIQEKQSDGSQKDLTTDEAVVVNSTGIVISNVAENPFSIGYISLGSLKDDVKALKIDGVVANTANVVNGTYKVSRPFNIATKGTPSEAAQDFINYILSSDGQDVIEENGYIKMDESAPAYSASSASGKVVVAGSSSVSPVMEKLAEAYKKVNSDVTVEIQTSDSSTGMQNTIDGACDIGMASRDLKDAETAELTGTSIALDGIAVVVNPENPVEGLTKEQVKEIFTGSVTSWKDFE